MPYNNFLHLLAADLDKPVYWIMPLNRLFVPPITASTGEQGSVIAVVGEMSSGTSQSTARQRVHHCGRKYRWGSGNRNGESCFWNYL
jgi:hypothetical protein